MLAVDTETTGLDNFHEARPFFITTCSDDGRQRSWEWDVDPLTREVLMPDEDRDAVREYIESASQLILQNCKFDITALRQAGVVEWTDSMWEITEDTICSGHLLASNLPHNLTDMVKAYVRVDISKHEKLLKDAVVSCRKPIQQAKLKAKRRTLIDDPLAHWKIAREGEPGMPSASDETWKFDMWLPRAMARYMEYPEPDPDCGHAWRGWNCAKCGGHRWWNVLAEYSDADSLYTLLLWKAHKVRLDKAGLWDVYRESINVLPSLVEMEKRGITAKRSHLEHLKQQYQGEVECLGALCRGIAKSLNFDLTLPKGASPNNSLREFCFHVLGLEPRYSKKSKTDAPSLDKEAMGHYQETLEDGTKQALFVDTLMKKRKKDTALAFIHSYENFWQVTGHDGIMVLHSSCNPTGTVTTRFSMKTPNGQQISKQEIEAEGEAHSARYMFGPAPGREWYSLDADNLELRLPAYYAGEEVMIDLFERPNDHPYFGSNHLLACHILHPDLFEECLGDDGVLDGRIFKKKYKSTWYQWTKNGNFAVQYGAMATSGTADRAYHVRGGQLKIQERLGKISDLNRMQIAHAEKYGQIITMYGYPLLCTRTERGNILPTVPLSYFVQGTAGGWMRRAMIRCHAQLKEWREDSALSFDAFITLTVHDELVFDFPMHPSGRPPTADLQAEQRAAERGRPGAYFRTSNLWRVRVLQRLMEMGGEDIGIPTSVNVEYHPDNWGEGTTLPKPRVASRAEGHELLITR